MRKNRVYGFDILENISLMTSPLPTQGTAPIGGILTPPGDSPIQTTNPNTFLTGYQDLLPDEGMPTIITNNPVPTGDVPPPPTNPVV